MSRDPEIRRLERCASCAHPSAKCLICGKAIDLIKSEERARIADLSRQVETLAAVLASLGYERVDIGYGVVELTQNASSGPSRLQQPEAAGGAAHHAPAPTSFG